MPGIHDPWLFALTVLVLNATPGVDLVLTLTRTLQHGIRGGLATALGISTGCVLHALGAAFGLAALLAASALAFAVVKWAGAAYLLWLAFGMLRAALRPAAPSGRPDAAADCAQAASSSSAVAGAGAGAAVGSGPAPTGWQLFRQGLLTNALNPKVALFFLALLPQFIDGDAPHKTLAFLFLGAWFVVQGTAFLVAFVLLVAPLRRWRPSATVERTIQGLGGTLFMALAAKLALAPRP